MGDLLEAARRVEAGGELIGERLIVDKAVDARRADGLLVKALGIELPAFRRAISAPTSAARFSKLSGQFAAQSSSCL